MIADFGLMGIAQFARRANTSDSNDDQHMADGTTEIDLDSVIDRLLEGACHRVTSAASSLMLTYIISAREQARETRPAAGVRDQVPVHKGARNIHQPTHPTRARSSHKDLWCAALPFFAEFIERV